MKRGENRSSVDRGRAGENAAVAYLKGKGFSIIARNRLICGVEIDIIASDESCLCFIEVKTRNRNSAGEGFEYVDLKKQNRYIRAAEVFVTSKKYQKFDIRFDVISVITGKESVAIDHLKEAFWRDG